MNQTTSYKHSRNSILISLSKSLERTGYYGLRSILVLYMVGQTMKLPDDEALHIYGFMISALLFAKIIGAVLGDFVIGNKRSVYWGVLLQSIGAFILCIDSITGLYIGIGLSVIGGGLYNPNIIASLSKEYLGNVKQIDSGYTIFYMSINLGAFLGSLFVGLSYETYGANFGFIMSGLLFIAALIPYLFVSNPVVSEIKKHSNNHFSPIKKIVITMLVIGVFWAIYDMTYVKVFEVVSSLTSNVEGIVSKGILESIGTSLTLPLGVVLAIIWTYKYSSTFKKLMTGLLMATFAYLFLLFIPEEPSMSMYVIYAISIAVSEIYLAPAVFSVVTQYVNPKYLTTVMALSFLPSRIISRAVGLIGASFLTDSSIVVKIGLGVMILMSIVMMIVIKRMKGEEKFDL